MVSIASSFKKKIKVKLELLTDIGMLLLVEKGIRSVKVTLFTDTQKLIKYAWKVMIESKYHHIVCIEMQITFFDGKCHKNY